MTVRSPQVRHVAAADRRRWEQLWLGYLTFYDSSVPQHVTDATFARLLEDGPVGGLVAVDADDRVVGLAHYVVHPTTWDTRPTCYLEDLFVAPDQRGGGAGRALIEHLAALGRHQGWAGVYWMTADDNAVARRLYDRLAEVGNWVRYEIDLPAQGSP